MNWVTVHYRIRACFCTLLCTLRRTWICGRSLLCVVLLLLGPCTWEPGRGVPGCRGGPCPFCFACFGWNFCRNGPVLRLTLFTCTMGSALIKWTCTASSFRLRHFTDRAILAIRQSQEKKRLGGVLVARILSLWHNVDAKPLHGDCPLPWPAITWDYAASGWLENNTHTSGLTGLRLSSPSPLLLARCPLLLPSVTPESPPPPPKKKNDCGLFLGGLGARVLAAVLFLLCSLCWFSYNVSAQRGLPWRRRERWFLAQVALGSPHCVKAQQDSCLRHRAG